MRFVIFSDDNIEITGVLKEELLKHSFNVEIIDDKNEMNADISKAVNKDTFVILISRLSSGYCSPFIKGIMDKIGEDKRPAGIAACVCYDKKQAYGYDIFLGALSSFCEHNDIPFSGMLAANNADVDNLIENSNDSSQETNIEIVPVDNENTLGKEIRNFANSLILFVKQNKTMLQDFEWYIKPDKTHWQRVAIQAKALRKMGIDCVWLPPAYKGAHGVEDTGYAVYDLYDLGEFNQKGSVATKYGTRKEYLKAIKALQNEGIEVLADIVLGHRMGADEKERIFAYCNDAYNRNNEVTDDKQKITVWTKFTFPGRNGKYSDFKWDWTHFHGTDYDAKNDENGIYRFIGKEWDSDVDNEFGNYDYLMGVDLDMSDEEVVGELNRWGEWYYETTGVDGFRIDAVKHIDFSFFKNWLTHLRTTFNKKFFAVGEYWNSELPILVNYIEKTEGVLSIFDVPLHFNMHHASTSFGYYDMRNILKNTVVSYRPDLAVTFVDNHDTQPGQALESFVLDWFKPHAYSLILLRDLGYPCVFYGDLYGIPHNEIPKVSCLETLMLIRKNYAYGTLHDYFDDPKIVGFTREGIDEIEESGVAVLMTVEKGGSKKMYIGKHFSGLLFKSVVGSLDNEVKIDENGYGMFNVEDGQVCVYILKEGQIVNQRDFEYRDDNEVSAFENMELRKVDADEQD